MTEAELYKELGALTKEKDRWKESIPYVSSLLTHDSVKIQAKALWLLGEMGLIYPQSVQDTVPSIASFLDKPMKLMSLAMKPVSSPPFPLERIEEMTRLMGGDGELKW